MPRILFRNLCAQDWCMKHPDGTAAEFKQYYDHELSNEDKKVRLICSNVQRMQANLFIFPQTYERQSKEAKAKVSLSVSFHRFSHINIYLSETQLKAFGALAPKKGKHTSFIYFTIF